MLPDDDMLKAFIADTLTKEDEQPPAHVSGRVSQGGEAQEPLGRTKDPATGPSMKRRGLEFSLKPIIKWGVLILALLWVWFVVSK
jgi:hypothetical protein